MVRTTPKLFFVLLMCFSLRFSESHKFSKDFIRCRPIDNDCIVKRANDVVRNHTQGYADIMLDKFEPLWIDDLKISGNPDSPVNLNCELSNVMFYGYSNMTFTKFGGFTNDLKDIKLENECIVSQATITGKYKISGRLLILPLTGEGDFKVTLINLQIKTRMKPKVQVRNGKTYLASDMFKIKTKVGGMNLKLANLFDGDKLLGDTMLKIMNDNWKLLWDELEPDFNLQISKASSKLIDSILNTIPYDELFIID